MTVEGASPMRKLLALVPCVVACAAGQGVPAASPGTEGGPPAESAAAPAPAPGKKPIAPAAVPPPPPECALLVAHPTSGCIPAGKARDMLAAAVSPKARAIADR